MTYLEAAHTILTHAGEPLNYTEITRRALDQSLIQPAGRTPAATMGARLYTNTKLEDSNFVRVGRGTFDLARRQSDGIDAQVQHINQKAHTRLRRLLHAMPPDRFEHLVMELLLQMGFDENTVQVTPYHGDGGIDVTGVYRAAGLTEVSTAVQVKRWKNNITAPTVTQLRGSLQVHQHGIIITASDFSRGARSEAVAPNKTRIGLINGDELVDLLIKHQVGVEEQTLRVVALDEEWWGELLASGHETAEPQDQTSGTIPTPKPTDLPFGPTGHKPDGFTLFGRRHPARTWRSLLITVCNTLADRHGQDFAATAATIKGQRRQYIAQSTQNMIRPAPIPGTDLYVETNLSAKDTTRLARRLLTACEHSPNELQISSTPQSEMSGTTGKSKQ